MVVLIFGDIYGKPGRRAVAASIPRLRDEYHPDFIIGNAENLAGGRGINKKTFREMMDLGFHALTGGNHTWDNKEIFSFIGNESRLIRPANYPSLPDDPCPGRGYGVITNGSDSIFLINLLGRVFMDDVDCPFQTVDKILKEAPTDMPIFVDMHADCTSEKYAMGWHLDGRVTAVTGTHSHVQTADARLLNHGTAYITDVGMSGSFDSVIGMKKEEVIRKYLIKRKVQTEAAKKNPGVSCVVIKTDVTSNEAVSIERLRFTTPEVDDDDDRDYE